MRDIVERVCSSFVETFGTPWMFVACLIVFLMWLIPMVWLGVQGWNGGPGLLWNTSSSTVELFLEIAILVVAKRTHDKVHEDRG